MPAIREDHLRVTNAARQAYYVLRVQRSTNPVAETIADVDFPVVGATVGFRDRTAGSDRARDKKGSIMELRSLEDVFTQQFPDLHSAELVGALPKAAVAAQLVGLRGKGSGDKGAG